MLVALNTELMACQTSTGTQSIASRSTASGKPHPLTVPLPLPAFLKHIGVVVKVGPAILKVIHLPFQHSFMDYM